MILKVYIGNNKLLKKYFITNSWNSKIDAIEIIWNEN